MSRKPLLFSLTLFLILLSPPLAARAQTSCAFDRETITTLPSFDFTEATVWDGIIGGRGAEGFASGVAAHDGGNVVAGGNAQDEMRREQPRAYLAEVNRRGRIEWQFRDTADFSYAIQKVLRTADGYIALGDTRNAKGRHGLTLARFDKAGVQTKRTDLFDDHLDVFAADMIALPDGGHLIALNGRDRIRRDVEQDAYIFRTNAEDAILWRRGFNNGGGSRILGLSADPWGSYLLAGQSVELDGRRSGWAVQVDETGRLNWQVALPRGAGSLFRAVRVHPAGTYVLAGDADPAEKGYKATWVVMLDRLGKIVWERYFRLDASLYGRDLDITGDGLISVLLDIQKPAAVDARIQSRLLSLTPQGQLIGDRPFMQGVESSAYQLIRTNDGDQAIIGVTLSRFDDEPALNRVGYTTEDGWIAVFPAPEEFVDPCKDVPPR